MNDKEKIFNETYIYITDQNLKTTFGLTFIWPQENWMVNCNFENTISLPIAIPLNPSKVFFPPILSWTLPVCDMHTNIHYRATNYYMWCKSQERDEIVRQQKHQSILTTRSLMHVLRVFESLEKRLFFSQNLWKPVKNQSVFFPLTAVIRSSSKLCECNCTEVFLSVTPVGKKHSSWVFFLTWGKSKSSFSSWEGIVCPSSPSKQFDWLLCFIEARPLI